MHFIFVRPRTKIKIKKRVRKSSTTGWKVHVPKAKEIVEKYISKHNQNNKFNYGRITIRNQKTRWGSCSGKNNLNFNYRIVFLPEHLAEYLVVHELCHLLEMNHSSRFWGQVENILPNYKSSRRELKKISFSN